MSPRDLRSILTSWACWIEAGRPVPFNCWPPRSILARLKEPHSPTFDSKPLWHGKLRSFWLADVHRLLSELPEARQCILLGMSLPGRGTDQARAKELGISLAQWRHAREMAQRALEAL